MVFPVVMYGWESWTINKAEHQKIDAFWTGVGEDSWESLGLQGDQTSQSYRKSVLSSHWKDWCWSWSSNTLATWKEELIHWKRVSSLLGKLKAGGEGDDRGRNGWMASPTWWSWVWASSMSWWTGKPGMPQSMGSQRVRRNWATELTEWRLRRTEWI